MNLFVTAIEKEMINNDLINNDLLNDLSNYLIGFLQPFNLKFFWAQNEKGEDEIYLYEVFMINGGLSLFLFNTEEIIENYVKNKKNSDGEDLKIDILFIEQHEDTYFGFYPKIRHNLIGNNLYHNDTSMYYDFIDYLAKYILQEKGLSFKEDKVYIDQLYPNLCERIKVIKFERNNDAHPKDTAEVEQAIVEIHPKLEEQNEQLDTSEAHLQIKEQTVENSNLKNFRIKKRISKKTNKNNT